MPRTRKRPPAAVLDAERSVAEVMGTSLFTLTPDTGIAAALRFASTRDVHHFLVVDDGSLTGIVCDSDLHGARGASVVADCMISPVLCIAPETTIEEAAGIMEENGIDYLPVVTGRFLVGVITRETIGRFHLDVDVQKTSDGKAARPAALACTACGGKKQVTRDSRSNFLPMCLGCMGAPTTRSRGRGN